MEQQYPQQFQTDFSSQEKSKKTWSWILVPILILLGGLVIALATKAWDPLWNPFRPRPEKVLERMILKMKELKTAANETKISLAAQNKDGSSFEMEIELREKEDLREKENPKSEGDFYFSFGGGASKSRKTPSFVMGGKISFAGEYKNLNQKSFVRLTTLPADFWLSSFLPQLSSLKNQWIRIDKESLLEMVDSFVELVGGLAAEKEMASIYKEQLKEQIERQEALQKKLEMVIQKEIETAVLKKQLFLVKKQLPDKKLNDIVAYHYLMKTNTETLTDMVWNILKAMEDIMAKELGASLTFNKEDFEQESKKVFDRIGEVTFDIWIGKKDYYLYKLSGEKTLEDEVFVSEKQSENQYFTPDISKQAEVEKITIKLEINFSNFNVPIEITEPKGAKSLKEALLPLIKQLFETLEKMQNAPFYGLEFELKDIPRR